MKRAKCNQKLNYLNWNSLVQSSGVMCVQVSCSVPGSSFDLLTWFLAIVRLIFTLCFFIEQTNDFLFYVDRSVIFYQKQ